MKIVTHATGTLACLAIVSGCATADYSGRYAPGCTAFAGDTIELAGDRFVWDKFTDEVRISADGKREDQFPAHPMKGHYEIDGDKLILRPDAGGVTSVFYMVSESGNRYVMNVKQHSQWRATGAMPDCALTRAE